MGYAARAKRSNGDKRQAREARADARQMQATEWGGDDVPFLPRSIAEEPQYGAAAVAQPANKAERPGWGTGALGTAKDVAALLQVHAKTVERWRRLHGLPCLRLGGSLRYVLSDVLRWASARKEGA